MAEISGIKRGVPPVKEVFKLGDRRPNTKDQFGRKEQTKVPASVVIVTPTELQKGKNVDVRG